MVTMLAAIPMGPQDRFATVTARYNWNLVLATEDCRAFHSRLFCFAISALWLVMLRLLLALTWPFIGPSALAVLAIFLVSCTMVCDTLWLDVECSGTPLLNWSFWLWHRSRNLGLLLAVV